MTNQPDGKKSPSVPISPSLAGKPAFSFRGVDYRRAHLPELSSGGWYVYGGIDGSVLVFKPERNKWYLAKETVKTNGLKFFTLLKGSGSYFQPYTHQIIAWAFLGGPPSAERSAVHHKNGDYQDNAAENLEWRSRSEIASLTNQRKATDGFVKNRRTSVTVRRDVLDELRWVEGASGQDFDDLVDQIFMEHIRKMREGSSPGS